MNHEILFKGKRVDNGEWIEGFYAECKDGAFITQKSVGKMGSGFQTTWVGGETQTTNYCILGRFYEVVPETVGRYTGMTDKNGVKIFEGDILRFRSGDYVVEWCNEHSKFLQADKEFSRGLYICIDESEVVGNIHDGGIEI